MIDYVLGTFKLIARQAAAGDGQFVVIAILLLISLYIAARLILSLLQERVIQIALVLIVAVIFILRTKP